MIAKRRERKYPEYEIPNWMKLKCTISFIVLWKFLYSANFEKSDKMIA